MTRATRCIFLPLQWTLTLFLGLFPPILNVEAFPTPKEQQKVCRASILSSLLRALSDKSKYVQEDAIKALGKLKPSSKKVIAALHTKLYHNDSTLRQAAAGALQRWGNQATPSFQKALRASSPPIRALAAGSLHKAQLNNTIEKALLRAMHDPSSFVRCNAAHSLGKLKASSNKAISQLLKLLQHKNKSVQSCAAYALGDLRPTSLQISKAITKLLQAKPCQACYAAAHALKQSPPTIIPILHKLLSHPGWENRYYASQVLRRFGKQASPTVPALTRAVRRTNGAIWGDMAKTLIRISLTPKKTVSVLLPIAKHGDRLARCGALKILHVAPKHRNVRIQLLKALREGHKLRRCALTALNKMGKEGSWAIPALLNLSTQDLSYVSFRRNYKFHHDGELERIEIASTLANLGPQVLPHLKKRLQYKSPTDRAFAAQTLSIMGKAAAPLYRHLLQAISDTNKNVRWHALVAIAKLQRTPKKAPQPLLQMLQAKEPSLRHLAVKALAGLGHRPQQAFAQLRKDTQSPKKYVQVSAIETLPLFGSKSLPTLLQLLSSKRPGARLAAMQAIGRMKKLPCSQAAILLRGMQDNDLLVRRTTVDVLVKLYLHSYPKYRR